jgi:ADP-ribose pyrophosphatase
MPFRVLDEKLEFRGRVFDLKTRRVRLPTGRETSIHVVEHPGSVVIAPVHENGDVVLVRQLRPAIGETIYELPAGTLEPGEAPAATARREIVEEAGLRAGRMTKITEFWIGPGFCTEKMHLFLATGLVPARGELDADEVMTAVRMPYARAMRMIDRGEICDAKSIVGLLLARTRVGGHGRRKA